MILDFREKQRRWLLRQRGIESGDAFIGPETVQFQLTDVCNLSCKYCWYFGENSPIRPVGKNHFSYELFENIAEDCRKLQVDTIHLSGVGDPIFHPRFYDMLRHLERSFAVTIYSNGTFPIDRCRDILRADRIVINLGAGTRQAYKELQGGDFLVKVLKNIRQLAKLKPKINPKFCIEVLFVVNRLNEATLPETEKLVLRMGADKIQRKLFQPDVHNSHLMLPGQVEKTQLEGEWPSCYYGWLFSAIRLNGDVNICIFSVPFSMGNVFKAPFKEIWESETYTKARLSALRGEDPYRSYHECINCRWGNRNKKIGEKIDMVNKVLRS